jgi:hypothetical protein
MANTGIPMVAMTLPLMVLLLVPVVIIEASIVRKSLNLDWRKSIKTMLGANLVTTFLGLPLSNLISMVIAFAAKFVVPDSTFAHHRTLLKATFGTYWFDDRYFTFTSEGKLIRPMPYEPWWYFVLAVSVAFFINLLVSFYLEYRFMRGRIVAPDRDLRQASLRANSVSYVFLLAATILIAILKR